MTAIFCSAPKHSASTSRFKVCRKRIEGSLQTRSTERCLSLMAWFGRTMMRSFVTC